MVASRGPGGPLNLAGLAQANIVTFFFGMFAISYVTSGFTLLKGGVPGHLIGPDT